MSNFNELKPIKVKPITKDIFEIKKYEKNVFHVFNDENAYVVIKRINKQENQTINCKFIELFNLDEININDAEFQNNIGTSEDFIIDMNGIDNFIFAESLVFYDSTIREIALKLGLLCEDSTYIRVGVSGAQKNNEHPGGEVFEYQILSGTFAEGISKSTSGYLTEPHFNFSKSIPLTSDLQNLLEERIVYSHTAWLKKLNKPCGNSYHFSFPFKNNNANLLDALYEMMEILEHYSYSIQICIDTSKFTGNVRIKGRVLKHMPSKPLTTIKDAENIAIEKEFILPKNSKLYVVGTKYKRYEPEWESFTNGHIYEKRGHYHGTIVNTKNTDNIHQTFHVREIVLSNNSFAEVILTPINNVYRIYPVYKNNGQLVCKSTKKTINDLIREIKQYDKG